MTLDRASFKRLALLPARGGSKRIPRKNIADFHGRPMISYSINAAFKSGLFDRVHVSSDDDEIRRISDACGADTSPRRPAELADDFTGILPVAKWVLETFAKDGERYDDVVIVFPCAPMLKPDDLTAAYEIYLDHGRTRNLLSVCRAPSHVERYYRRQENGALAPLTPGGNLVRSQDLDTAYYETGTFTIFSAEWLLSSETLFDDTNYISYELPPWRSVDIDSPEDLENAKALYAAFARQDGSQ